MYYKLIEATRAGCDHRQAALRAIDISHWNSWMGSVSLDSCLSVFDRRVSADAQQPSSGRLFVPGKRYRGSFRFDVFLICERTNGDYRVIRWQGWWLARAHPR
jgi:hypothetical protein